MIGIGGNKLLLNIFLISLISCDRTYYLDFGGDGEYKIDYGNCSMSIIGNRGLGADYNIFVSIQPREPLILHKNGLNITSNKGKVNYYFDVLLDSLGLNNKDSFVFNDPIAFHFRISKYDVTGGDTLRFDATNFLKNEEGSIIKQPFEVVLQFRPLTKEIKQQWLEGKP